MFRPFWSDVLAHQKLVARQSDANHFDDQIALADTVSSIDGTGLSIALQYLRADLEYVTP